mgnify:CR=1 FL=1
MKCIWHSFYPFFIFFSPKINFLWHFSFLKIFPTFPSSRAKRGIKAQSPKITLRIMRIVRAPPFQRAKIYLIIFLVISYGDVTYNPRRSILGAISVGEKIGYHLYNFTTSKAGNIVKLPSGNPDGTPNLVLTFFHCRLA